MKKLLLLSLLISCLWCNGQKVTTVYSTLPLYVDTISRISKFDSLGIQFDKNMSKFDYYYALYQKYFLKGEFTKAISYQKKALSFINKAYEIHKLMIVDKNNTK